MEVAEAAEACEIDAGRFEAGAVKRRAVPATPDLPAEPMVLKQPTALDRERLELCVPVLLTHELAEGVLCGVPLRLAGVESVASVIS